MTLISNLTAKIGNRLALAVALGLLCQTGFAQSRYPLHSSTPAKTTTNELLKESLIFSDLPKLQDPVRQRTQPRQVMSNDPVATTRNLLSDGSDSSFQGRSLAQPGRPNEFGSVSYSNHARNSRPIGKETLVGPFAVRSSEQSLDPGSDTATWWKPLVLSPIYSSGSNQPVDTNSLVYGTLQNSPRIRAISLNPLIRELQVIEADSDFDAISFIRSQFEDRVDPIGNVLSGVPDGILKDNIWSGEFGIRRKLRTGATYELGQTLGFKNSNSNFFVPQDQGTATLALNVTQPLLRGRGRYYNQSQILIAQSASGAAWDTFSAELQEEIQETVRAYWQLYFDRSVYLQKKKNVERGINVLQILEGRRELDSLPSQITRARSAVKLRKTDLANCLRDIRDSETELRRLTAERGWQASQHMEMLPTESPSSEGIEIGLEQVVYTALEHRPEIQETMARAKIACIQRDVSENELLPELSFLMGTYVSGLKGESQLGQAIQDQFGEATPGYSFGLEFELPIRNRAARSRYAQRQLALTKIRAEVDETMQNVIAESQVSLRRVSSAKETLAAALQAIEAAHDDLEQNYHRWEVFALVEGDFADGQTPTTALDQLLDSQERLTAAELVYTQSELELKTAEVELQRTMGTLLIHENVSYCKSYDCDVPEIYINRSEGNPSLIENGQFTTDDTQFQADDNQSPADDNQFPTDSNQFQLNKRNSPIENLKAGTGGSIELQLPTETKRGHAPVGFSYPTRKPSESGN